VSKKVKAISRHFKHQIIFLENLAIREVTSEEWQEKFTTYAEIKPICDTSFESLESLNFGHINMTKGFFLFKMRFITGVTTKLRILFKERKFEIKRVINIDERDRLLNIITLEI
jgi:head-tail adaptor